MSDDLDRLEQEVESQLAALAGQFAVKPPGPLVLRVRAAVRHELNEVWLADQDGPRPSGEVLQRVYQAVREELGRTACGAGRSARARTMAALAAAAMIAVSVGVIRFAGTLKPAAPPADTEAAAHLDLFMAAAEEAFTSDPLTVSIDDDLMYVEDDIDRLRSAPQGNSEGLGDLIEEIDQRLAEPAKGKGASLVRPQAEGAFG